MLERALIGDKKYWAWLCFLGTLIGAGTLCYLWQFFEGLGITGLSRDVSWGVYIGQFTFLVGVAASGVMVVLPYYLHNYKAFGKMTILGEFLAIASVVMCMTFIFVDMGQPLRMTNVFLYPSPSSPMFWDSVVLFGYLVLNVVIGAVTLDAERKGTPPPKWIKPVIYLSIPWAISIHTVTAFLYSGLPGRAFWMTAVLAPRFLASAFSAGPALLILLCFVMRKTTKFDAGKEAIQKLAMIVTYAMVVNVFLVLMEFFTAFYSNIPEHVDHFRFLYTSFDGSSMAPAMWLSALLAITALVLLIPPASRKNETLLIIACIAVYVSLWIDKGLGMVVAGFIPTPMHTGVTYLPTLPECIITLGIYAIGALIVTCLYKIALSVRGETG
jgi:[DsrC]-trisulfide reductase subunit P